MLEATNDLGRLEQRQLTRRFYDRYPYGGGGAERKRLWEIRLGRHLDLRSVVGEPTLDAGCGCGLLAELLEDLGAESHALDLSATGLRALATRKSGLRLVQGDLLRLPFRTGRFQLVVAVGSLHHTPDAFHTFAECARVTRPGGDLFVVLYTRYHFYPLVYRLLSSRLAGRQAVELPRWWRGAFRRFLSLVLREPIAAEDADNVLADQLLTPVISFHSAREVRRWAATLGLSPAGTESMNLGQMRIYHIHKAKTRPGAPTPVTRG